MGKFTKAGLILLIWGFLIGDFPARANEIEVIQVTSNEIPSLDVRHHVKENQVMVECIVIGISFRESDHGKQKAGKMVIWVDGEIKSEAASAAFIIKGLTSGSHKIKIEVVNLHNEPYGLSKEFMVKIPK